MADYKNRLINISGKPDDLGRKDGDMKYVAGVDIGNATTEVALAKIDGTDLTFLRVGIGPKPNQRTLQNIMSFLCL